jgi:hypothetical protein
MNPGKQIKLKQKNTPIFNNRGAVLSFSKSLAFVGWASFLDIFTYIIKFTEILMELHGK